jgi:hypothetical protein
MQPGGKPCFSQSRIEDIGDLLAQIYDLTARKEVASVPLHIAMIKKQEVAHRIKWRKVISRRPTRLKMIMLSSHLE